ncbi:hypothetical protein H9L39_17109 [Fusarium oxysporum f. sp. albedinis]|nr:hypothetical protein H9L39_17109 [Fusarium oxysporum f. sp. albedinis]
MDLCDHALRITPPSTPDDTDYDDEQAVKLPVSRKDVNELSGPASQGPPEPAQSPRDHEGPRGTKGERAIIDWFAANQYRVVERRKEKLASTGAFTGDWRRLQGLCPIATSITKPSN